MAAAVLVRDGEPAVAFPPYRITYDVLDPTTGKRTTEVVEVDRPRVSRRLLADGGSATTESGVYDRVAGHWRQLAVVAPGEPGDDLQLRAPLAWAERTGLARKDGNGMTAGHRCTWWLTREPVDVGSFATATSADRARSCVDDQGRLLADTWRSGGRELRRRTATAVTRPASVSAFDGAEPQPIDPRLVTTMVQRLRTPTADLVRPRPPAGAKTVAAAHIVEVAPGSTDVVRSMQRAVYVAGAAVIVLDQIREVPAPADPRGDVEVALGKLGTGRVHATGSGIVIEVRVGAGLLRVRSGLDFDPLVRWLSTLDTG